MKTNYIIIALLLLPFLGVAQENPNSKSNDEETIDQIANEFFDCVMSPSKLFLSITDDASLAKAKKSLEKNGKKIDVLVAGMKKLKVPSNEEKKLLGEVMEAREAMLKEEIGEKLGPHGRAMSKKHRSSWQQAVQKFYKNLDKHKEVLAKYLEPAKTEK